MVCAASLPVDLPFRKVALETESSYAEIYKIGLSRSAYNFVLTDYSYFQFSWDSLDSWRLAYFPNPWITGSPGAQEMVGRWEALEEVGGISFEEATSLIDELPYKGAVPPIRFEYARTAYREIAHPAAHFHMGRNEDNRWPCAVLLGPVAFSMLIARLYYPVQWRLRSSYHGAPTEDCLERRFGTEVGASAPVSDFSSAERLALHFGRNMLAVVDSGRQPSTGNRPRSRRPK